MLLMKTSKENIYRFSVADVTTIANVSQFVCLKSLFKLQAEKHNSNLVVGGSEDEVDVEWLI